MLIFFDTEFTALSSEAECLSIGLVTEYGERELYLERSDVDRSACSDFVIEQVLPLFGRYPKARRPYLNFAPALQEWLQTLRGEHRFACDSYQDFRFLSSILQGDFPDHCRGENQLLGREEPELWEQRIAHYFIAHPDQPRHHALYDARALREAYLRSAADLPRPHQ